MSATKRASKASEWRQWTTEWTSEWPGIHTGLFLVVPNHSMQWLNSFLARHVRRQWNWWRQRRISGQWPHSRRKGTDKRAMSPFFAARRRLHRGREKIKAVDIIYSVYHTVLQCTIQLNPAIPEVKGLTNFICYW